MVKRKALVTGGAGFIGSQLCKTLVENRYDVTVLDDLSNGSGLKNLPKNVKFIKGDILDKRKIKLLCNKMDVVFHLAVKPLAMSFEKPEEVVRVNDFGTYLVTKSCVESKTKMIHVSSSEVYGTAMKIPMKENHALFPSTIYASSKVASEVYVRAFEKSEGLKMVIVRPFNSYGPFMRDDIYAAVFPKVLERLYQNKPPIIYWDGKQTRDFTFVSDTANGIMLADIEPKAIGGTFNIGQGKETTIKKLSTIMIEKYEDITNKKINHKFQFRKKRKGDVRRHLSDISHAKKILGYKPSIKLDEGILEYLKWKMTK